MEMRASENRINLDLISCIARHSWLFTCQLKREGRLRVIGGKEIGFG